MVKRQHPNKTQDFAEAVAKYSHLKDYLNNIVAELGEPTWVTSLDRKMREGTPNILYPVGDPIFVHIYRKPGEHTKYNVIEPVLNDELQKAHDLIVDKMVEHAHKYPVPNKIEDAGDIIKRIFDEVVKVGDPHSLERYIENKVILTQEHYDEIWYLVYRNRVGYGKLEPFFYDPYIEDIHCTGVGLVNIIHKIYEMVQTNLTFRDDMELNKYILDASERVERPVSDAHSVVDAVMPDGSRVNFIYGRELSLQGSSFTIRKFAETPVSITQIVNWKTMSAELAAYIWICLENGMNMFICGETASGKTTTLNASAAFIKPNDKIFSVENTPEVTIPHDIWQHLVTREAGKETDVTIFHLLIAALRSRPNYIIVGEIRGAEGNVAFQAMQTGHPVISTFHAGNPHTMIQRITSHPINVPIASIDNLHIVLIQQAVVVNGRFERRVMSITEIERYYDAEKKVITREVFSWDSVNDVHRFRGLYNSYILERKIAAMRGYADTREIYKELELRAKILTKMVENQIFSYYDVWNLLKKFHEEGVRGLPFVV
jgi:archaeal flagellar protein FlaI